MYGEVIMAKIVFTRNDVLKINSQTQKQEPSAKSTSSFTVQKIVRESSFSKSEITSAFKEARRQITGKK